MELKKLVEYSEERCKAEKPILYGMSFWKNPKDFEKEKFNHPVELFARDLEGAYVFGESVEFAFKGPTVTSDLESNTIWSIGSGIDKKWAGDFLEIDRGVYETEVRRIINSCYFYKDDRHHQAAISSLSPFFMLVDLLEKRHREEIYF